MAPLNWKLKRILKNSLDLAGMQVSVSLKRTTPSETLKDFEGLRQEGK